MTLSRFIRLTALLLITALLGNTFAFAAKKPIDPAAIKAKIQERGVGQGIRVVLADKTEAKGTIITIGEQSFTVKPKGATQPREIEYVQIIGVHNQKLSRGQKVAITVGVVATVVVVTGIVIKILFDRSFSQI